MVLSRGIKGQLTSLYVKVIRKERRSNFQEEHPEEQHMKDPSMVNEVDSLMPVNVERAQQQCDSKEDERCNVNINVVGEF